MEVIQFILSPSGIACLVIAYRLLAILWLLLMRCKRWMLQSPDHQQIELAVIAPDSYDNITEAYDKTLPTKKAIGLLKHQLDLTRYELSITSLANHEFKALYDSQAHRCDKLQKRHDKLSLENDSLRHWYPRLLEAYKKQVETNQGLVQGYEEAEEELQVAFGDIDEFEKAYKKMCEENEALKMKRDVYQDEIDAFEAEREGRRVQQEDWDGWSREAVGRINGLAQQVEKYEMLLNRVWKEKETVQRQLEKMAHHVEEREVGDGLDEEDVGLGIFMRPSHDGSGLESESEDGTGDWRGGSGVDTRTNRATERVEQVPWRALDSELAGLDDDCESSGGDEDEEDDGPFLIW